MSSIILSKVVCNFLCIAKPNVPSSPLCLQIYTTLLANEWSFKKGSAINNIPLFGLIMINESKEIYVNTLLKIC